MKSIATFNSYAHLDQGPADRLSKAVDLHFQTDPHFRLPLWRDSAILPGEDWHQTIQTALWEAPVGLLFLSPAFFASGYIRDHEVKGLMATPNKVILPVLLGDISHRMDLQGLERLQYFTYRGKSYEQCSGPMRKRFELALYEAIAARLEKEFGA